MYFIAHPEEQPATNDNEASSLLESDAANDNHLLPDWCRVDIEHYMANRPFWTRCFAGGVPNRQQALYWMNRKGPLIYLFILQFDLLFVGIFSAIEIINVGPYMYHSQPLWTFILYCFLCLLPVSYIAINKRRLVAVLTPVCSLGFYRRPQVISSVIREEKTAQGVRTFITVYKLRRFAMNAEAPRKESRFHYSQIFEKHEIDEVGRTFDAFDLDGSGRITLDEFEQLMGRLGANFSDEELRTLVVALDTDKTGGVDRDEFLQWYADSSLDDDITVDEFSQFMFDVFDSNGSGELTIGEFKQKLDHVSTRFSVDEIGDLVNELDVNNSGTICREEFEHLIHKYYPKELSRSHHHRS